jgi:glutaredoxin
MSIRFTPTPRAAAWLVLAAALGSAGLQAQTVYRVVGPDGRVTFTDQPPPAAASPAPAGRGTAAAAGSGAGLPYELAQVAGRYPVVIYTGPQCSACDAGRALLTGRGIPYSERTVNTGDDVQALQRLSGDTGLPLLTVGGQQIKGYSDVEWSQYLDAAGYPRTSQLPTGWRAPAAAPLVATQRVTAPDAPAAAAAAATPPVEAVSTRPRPTPRTAPAPNTNPAGIAF